MRLAKISEKFLRACIDDLPLVARSAHAARAAVRRGAIAGSDARAERGVGSVAGIRWNTARSAHHVSISASTTESSKPSTIIAHPIHASMAAPPARARFAE